MSAMPELAPYDEPHLLSSTSVITSIVYSGSSIEYNTFDKESAEIIRLVKKPAKVMVNETELSETESSEPVGWTWTTLKKGGILKIFKKGGRNVLIGF
jgi:predicted metal-dependent RNase